MASLLAYLEYFFAGYAALIVFFYMLSLVIPKAAFVARSLASYIALLASTMFGVFISIAMRLVGWTHSAQWAAGRSFKYLMALMTGITFVVEDPKDTLNTLRPAVFIGNHQTELDVLMLGCMFPKHCSMTAKSSLKKTPFLGWFMTLSGCIFINRVNTKDARNVMAGAADEIRSKRQSVYLFPEGTRSYAKEPSLLPFKKGAFHLAIQAQVPIVPCVVANYSHIFSIKGFEFNAGTVPVKVLDPIPTAGLTAADVDELARTTRELMLKELMELTARVRGQALPAAKHTNGAVRASGVDMKVAA
ncbi:hypothetical protein B0T22DRAFT_13927 [Podospora appendiculata]|uniref:1-acyl-sn-glycerol-3-phosphate acyltransferase n=1 Tax=Podospora appendiculata TaxID=314037 RepID=A0AAE0XFD3_9PEZI|nr:hypothetical protein B0T22DRAFT_13927 [Podospora appendiculata]